ncbi:MAG TPA: FAD-dependent monooxygenase [Gemmatimonadales bacterium]|nr:FAD-dependent monooxygenase [Gemmatimonadales bacterium]
MRKRALIVGGGIGGLAAALAMRKAGWATTVFERASAFSEVGAGLSVWANGLDALDALGVGAKVRAAGRRFEAGAVRTTTGDVLFSLATQHATDGDRWIGVMIHRADLLDILVHAVGTGTLRAGVELQALEPRGERVIAHFTDGSTDDGDVLIGADGIHSTVRRAVVGPELPRYAGYTVWRWVAPFPAERVLPGETWGAGARFGQAALPGGQVYAYATHDAAPGGRASASGGERAEIERHFGGWHSPIPALIEAAPEGAILRHDCYDIRPLHSWCRGRVALLGDAAHAMTPNLGQGACQALEDAVALGRHLTGAGDVVGALKGYASERRPITARFQRRARLTGAIGQWRHPLALRLRRSLARRVLAPLSARAMRAMIERV